MRGKATGKDRAQEAAESAISSPLLDDMCLSGAKGILVNVTAGLDLSIGEFEEVGEIINAMASEDATVVVGAVIDPELEGEMRVTVVATGLDNTEAKAAKPKVEVVKTEPDAKVDHSQLDQPTVIRRGSQKSFATAKQENLEYLDIPAFLRRQAD